LQYDFVLQTNAGIHQIPTVKELYPHQPKDIEGSSGKLFAGK
jgi:hypothetical protein